jgi:hypothetical protein
VAAELGMIVSPFAWLVLLGLVSPRVIAAIGSGAICEP